MDSRELQESAPSWIMVWKKYRAAELLKEKLYHNSIIWHYLSHRIELTVHGAIVELNAINQFMENIYSVYSQSPKSTNQLKTIAACLSVKLTKLVVV